MTAVADSDLSRALGQVEGQLKGILATLDRVDKRSAARDEAFELMKDDIAALKEHAQSMIVVTQEFNKLQQAIREGKATSKGIIIGIGLAGGAGGAAVATFFKNIWAAIFGQ